jgi:hypothetical protein
VAHDLHDTSRIGHGLSPLALSAVEIVVLAPLAGVFAFWLIPDAFDIDWSCVTQIGVVRTPGDTFAAAVAVFGAIGWLFVLLGTLFAGIAERPRVAAALPIAWFVALVGGITVAALVVGPAPCPA